jgi:hypothetical protein
VHVSKAILSLSVGVFTHRQRDLILPQTYALLLFGILHI